MSSHKRKKSDLFALLFSGDSAKYSVYAFAAGLVAIFFVFLKYREPIKAAAEGAVNNFGYPALFFLCWAADVIIQPIPADVLVFGSVFGGSHLVKTALVAGLSSGMGGMTGYYLGRLFGPWRFRRLFGPKLLRRGRNLFRDHGALAIFVAGVSPVPYSAVCWIGGIYNMSLVKVVLASWISRTLRYLVVAYLGYLV
ncbi:MAG: YqaA family protein [Candidatus Rifleibacteriota bacterium]